MISVEPERSLLNMRVDALNQTTNSRGIKSAGSLLSPAAKDPPPMRVRGLCSSKIYKPSQHARYFVTFVSLPSFTSYSFSIARSLYLSNMPPTTSAYVSKWPIDL